MSAYTQRYLFQYTTWYRLDANNREEKQRRNNIGKVDVLHVLTHLASYKECKVII